MRTDDLASVFLVGKADGHENNLMDDDDLVGIST
jgi:hypothetical protein